MNDDVIKLVQITDPHLHAHKDARMRGVNTCVTLQAVLTRLHNRKSKPDAIIATGDLVQDETRGGYLRFAKMLKPLDVPVYCLPGNHDSPEIMQEHLNDAPFQYCGQATMGSWQLLMLNTHAYNDDSGQLQQEELDKLDADLTACAKQHAAIFLHHHPVPMGSRWLDGTGLRQHREFLNIVTSHKHVRTVVWGHVHQASDHEHEHIRMLSTPSTCSQFLPNSDDFAIDDRPPAYRWLNLYADGAIDTQVVWLEPAEYLNTP
jgi:3',5'-cyclic-AMP phosphodiesterase